LIISQEAGFTVLKMGKFKSNHKRAFHAASHWQVSLKIDFKKLEYDGWKQYENWYYKENRQKNDDLTDETTTLLKPNTSFYWRVRYKDQNLNWSDWSKTQSFKAKKQ